MAADPSFLPGFPHTEDYSKALLSHVMLANKSANDLPAEGDDFDYYSSFPGFQTFCSKISSRVQRSIGKILQHQQLPWYQPTGEGEKDESYEALVEANDVLLERVSVLLDEASGVQQQTNPVLPSGIQHGTAEVASWNKKKASAERTSNYKFIHSKNIQRPQLKFKDKADNDSSAFIPRIREKPNARQPLPQVFQLLQQPTTLNALIANAREWASCSQYHQHPYQYELENFEPLENQLQLTEPHPPASLEDTPLTYVDSLEQLQQLKDELSVVSEFAIDLEHHSYRSFQGFVCLMQISTASHDYLIDTLIVREHMHILLEPFTNPQIVKVLHGADWDVKWLQRDFGLYVVNLFDTGQASRVLGLPRFSLAFLLQYCCSIEADKQYQLADWRIRPLPTDMAKYAREDTHYLLYIYHRMRNELIRRSNKQQNLLHSVLDRSRDVALKQYSKPQYHEDDYLKLYHKHKKSFNSQQLYCLKLLYAWRDHAAREEDESVGYVLPNHMLFQISELLPREAQGVLACCNPIPTLLRQQLQEVYMLVQQAREATSQHLLAMLSHTASSTQAEELTQHTQVEKESRKSVDISGPPVSSGKPIMTALQMNTVPQLTDTAAKKLDIVLQAFPDIISMFIAANPGLPPTLVTGPGVPPTLVTGPGLPPTLVTGPGVPPTLVTGPGVPPTLVTGPGLPPTLVTGPGVPPTLVTEPTLTPPPTKRPRLDDEAVVPQKSTPTADTSPTAEMPQHEYVPPSKTAKEKTKYHPFNYHSTSFSDYTKAAHEPVKDSYSPSLQEPGRETKQGRSSKRITWQRKT